MIEVNIENSTYVCPFCGCRQSFSRNNFAVNSCYYGEHKEYISLYHVECTNQQCKKITVFAFSQDRSSQWDLIPQYVYKQYPDYIPKQIREDYKEAVSIINYSPKASATLFRRCLQGMIRDFWGIRKDRLNDEIQCLKGKVSESQWKAIDGLRKIGNIGAHMEKDVNLIIEIDDGESQKIQTLIELLIDKWYIARHDEEQVFADISKIAASKKEQKGA